VVGPRQEAQAGLFSEISLDDHDRQDHLLAFGGFLLSHVPRLDSSGTADTAAPYASFGERQVVMSLSAVTGTGNVLAQRVRAHLCRIVGKATPITYQAPWTCHHQTRSTSLRSRWSG
jgi:hypothetical protein